MLPPESIIVQALVNISNIRRCFEKHARKLFVVVDSLDKVHMDKIPVTTRSGRKASAFSIATLLRRSNGPVIQTKETEISKTGTDIIKDDFVTRRRLGRVKATSELEDTMLKAEEFKVDNQLKPRNLSVINTPKTQLKRTRPPNNFKEVDSKIKDIVQNNNSNVIILNDSTRIRSRKRSQNNEINDFETKAKPSSKKKKIERKQSEALKRNFSINKSKIDANESLVRRTSLRKQSLNKENIDVKEAIKPRNKNLKITNQTLEKKVNFEGQSSRRSLRKRKIKSFLDCVQELKSTKESSKKIPIYNKDKEISDSDNEIIKNKKDIYKFTEDILEKSDLNPYDKETHEIMHKIEKAEKIKAKRKLNVNKNKLRRNIVARPKKLKQNFIDVEIISSTNKENVRTYSSKKNNAARILADVIVHSVHEQHVSTKASLSEFDKLKQAPVSSNKPIEIRKAARNDDEIQVYEDIADMEHSDISRNTSPLLSATNNTPEISSFNQRQPVCHTKQVEIRYDRSNNFGFDEEVISPEKSILIHLNEVSRKLQKQTPWRNRLVIKNKRVLTIKSTSLPNVDQELILDSTMVDRLNCSNKQVKITQQEPKQQLQTKLHDFIKTNKQVHEESDLSMLFDATNLSPIKRSETLKNAPISKQNLISTPRQSFRRNILRSKNQELSPPSLIVNLRSSKNKSNENISNKTKSPLNSADLENSYFGFNSMNLEENSLIVEKSPLKLPTRIEAVDLRRFKKKYASKKQKAEEIKKLEAKMNEDNSASLNEDSVEDASEELSVLGLFDELLETEPEENPVIKKRYKKDDSDNITVKISRTKRRQKNEMSEFNKWAAKFNKMCKEIDNHKLHVE